MCVCVYCIHDIILVDALKHENAVFDIARPTSSNALWHGL